MAHVLADIVLTRCGIQLFLDALRQMPSLGEPDVDGTPTVFHHISPFMFKEISKWALETMRKEKPAKEGKQLSPFILEALFTPDRNGCFPISPYHMISDESLLCQIPNLNEMLHKKDYLGLTPTQID
eukprot:gb/GECH01009324.1/.p1 GENE.gb/GECH01009324.1/~~gb/GECH01009324.1/.p1  ORF type:complete len:127 (+),score=26.89 gb/GECH01009324.1/:1-381(+)